MVETVSESQVGQGEQMTVLGDMLVKEKPVVGEHIFLKEKNSIYRNKYLVIAETVRSWVLVPDKTPDYIIDGYRRDASRYRFGVKLLAKNKQNTDWWLVSKHDVDLAIWAEANRWRIRELLSVQTDVNVLLHVAQLIGYSPLPEESPCKD